MWVGRRLAIFASIGKRGGRRRGFAEKRVAVFAQEQDRRRLAGVIGGLPVPGASRIGGAEGGLHRGAQDAGVDAASAFEIGEKKPRGLSDGGGCRRERWRGRAGGRGTGRIRHEGDLGRAGTGRAARALSLDPIGSNPSRQASRSLRLHACAAARAIRSLPAAAFAKAGRRRSPWQGRGGQKQTRSRPEAVESRKMTLIGNQRSCCAITAARSPSGPIRNRSPHLLPRPMYGARRHAGMMLVENPAHRIRLLIPKRRAGDRAQFRVRGHASDVRRCGNSLSVDPGAAALRRARERRDQEADGSAGFGRRQVGFERVAVGEMAEGREQKSVPSRPTAQTT